jgi:acyl dehydratase
MRSYEEEVVGTVRELGSHTFTANEIKVFARKYDPQPFHLDEAAAAQSHFGALCASGWHTAATCMRLLVECGKRDAEERHARGEPIARPGPSPGFRELKWLKPVYVGDTITYTSELLSKRVSNSRPGWGLLQSVQRGTNQNGDLVMSFVSFGFVERKSAA